MERAAPTTICGYGAARYGEGANPERQRPGVSGGAHGFFSRHSFHFSNAAFRFSSAMRA